MSTLYVVDPRARVKREGATLLVQVGGKTKLRARLDELARCVLAGQSWISRPALEGLLARGIDTVLLDRGGGYVGRVAGPEGAHVELRLAQAAAVGDSAVCLRLARAMVVAKIRNCRRVIGRTKRAKEVPGVAALLAELNAARVAAQAAETLESLRGWEGQAAALCFKALRRLFPVDLGFKRRRRRPPPDPVNALLSLGYTLVGAELAGAVRAVGLDAHLGFLHRPLRGRESLALDLLEVFRPEAVDRLTLVLLRGRHLQSKDFEPAEEAGGLRLRQESFRDYLEAYEAHMSRSALRGPQRNKRSLSLREYLHIQARELRRAIESGERFRAYLTH